MVAWRSGREDAMMEGYECIAEFHMHQHEGKYTLKKRLLVPIFAALLTFTNLGLNTPAQQQSIAKPHESFNEKSAAERIANLDVLKATVKQYHDCTCTCGCYAHDLDAQAERAITFLHRRAARKQANEKLALVLDIDETSLTNYEELLHSGFNYTKRDWDAWVESAKAPVIPGTLRLYKEAQRLGIGVFFITGRQETQRAVTESNLSAQGYSNWQELILRPASAAKQSTSAYKSFMRAQIEKKGYRVALNVGDQWSDLKGAPEAEFSVKYPDPYYLIP
jgi:acid phosphatase